MGKIFSFVIILAAFSCKTQQQSTLQLISEKVGDNAIIDYNTDRSFALIQEKFTITQENEYTSKYLLIRAADNKIVKEGVVVHGYVKWANDDTIEIFNMPEVIKEGQDESDFKERVKVSRE